TKETGNCLFCLLGVWGKRPILATAVAKTFRRNRQTDLTFMLMVLLRSLKIKRALSELQVS
ncbi:hypothetical protein, partial [Lactococcus lactis]|uniref:hypothetical protein n=1 Tax=Lactococcus lactis TaxID=1358 RepID=UPI001BA7D17D